MLTSLLALLALGTPATPSAGLKARVVFGPQESRGTLTVSGARGVRWSVTTEGLYGVTSISLSRDGRYLLAVADGWGYVQLWDVKAGTRLHTYLAPKYRLLAAAFTPDGQCFLLNYVPVEKNAPRARFSSYWWKSSLWSIQDDTQIALTSKPERGSYYAKDVHFSADGQRMVFTDGSDPASVWNAVTGAYIQTLPRIDGRGATDAHLNADGTQATVTFVDEQVGTFNVQSGKLLHH